MYMSTEVSPLMAKFVPELSGLTNFVECVMFEILWHTMTKIVKHALIWLIVDFNDKQFSKMINYDQEH